MCHRRENGAIKMKVTKNSPLVHTRLFTAVYVIVCTAMVLVLFPPEAVNPAICIEPSLKEECFFFLQILIFILIQAKALHKEENGVIKC